ncbi:MAG TPA: response regulator transcription factor [Nitrospira sp.]|nr:response regulator transcription factor [Nitrospira sp.]
MTKSSLIRVLLAEDHTIVRQALHSLLQTYPNIDVVGEASDGEEVLAKVGKLHPRVVVMDLNMPKMDGITATRLIRQNYPGIAVVGLTVNPPGYAVDVMLQAGAFEVLTKDRAATELYGAIQRAVASVQPILVLEEDPVDSADAEASSEQKTGQAGEPAPADEP